MVFIGDGCAAALALSLVGMYTDWRYPDFSARDYVGYTVALGLGWLVALSFSGGYEHRAELFAVEEMRRIARASVGLLAVVAIPHFVLELDLFRRHVAISIGALVLMGIAWRVLARSVVSANHSLGHDQYKVVLCGSSDAVGSFAEQIRSQAQPPLQIVGISPDPEVPIAAEPLYEIPVYPPLTRSDIDFGDGIDLIVSVGPTTSERMWSLARLAHEVSIPLAVAPSRDDLANLPLGYLPVNGAPMLMVSSPALQPVQQFLKSSIDRVMALLALIALSPIFGIVAALIALRDGRPVLFRQTRVGRDGAEFEMIKFRTMIPDAHNLRTGLANGSQADGPLFKMRDDPRVTSLGRVLRRLSLDEIPQFWNVLRGQMSLVGPRPPLPDEVATYDDRTSRRLIVKPGITGLWQVEGRSDLSWDQGLYFDLYYVNHWSIVLDISIVLRTLRAVIRSQGAY